MATTAHGCHGRMPAGAGVRLRPYPQSATELTPGGSAPTPFPRLLTNALEVSDGSPHAPLGMKFRCAVAGCSFRSNRSHNFKRHTMTHTGATVSRRSARVYTVPADVGQEGGLPRTESVPSLASHFPSVAQARSPSSAATPAAPTPLPTAERWSVMSVSTRERSRHGVPGKDATTAPQTTPTWPATTTPTSA